MRKMDEKTLIRDCKRAEVTALKTVYEKYYGVMLGICIRYVKNRIDAEDLVQDGFMKVFKDIGSFEGRGSFEGWMKKVMINNALSFLKKPKKEMAVEDTALFEDIETGSNEPDEKELTIEDQIRNTDFTKEELIEVIQSLPPGYQQVLNMFVIDDFRHQEIARILNISEGTSKSQLNRARKLAVKKLYEKTLEKNGRNPVCHGSKSISGTIKFEEHER